MQCEICGLETKYPKVIMVEGSRITVCSRCTSHGTLVGNYQKGPARVYRRSRYKREEQFDIAADYDKLIRDARGKHGWKQEELARKINETTSVVTHLEKGKLSPSKKLAEKLEKTLGIKLIEAVSDERVEVQQEKSGPVTLGDIVKIRKR
ncbi:MAG: TIGR00270 family protein [Candidatus Diapherotrites archaeon]|nr:TIGR00270 family protein [Candidatus Diapherotrites archaeon]